MSSFVEGCSFLTGRSTIFNVSFIATDIYLSHNVENLTGFLIDMNKESYFIFILEEGQAAIACILDIWCPLFSPSTLTHFSPATYLCNTRVRWLQDVFQVPIVIQLTGTKFFLLFTEE